MSRTAEVRVCDLNGAQIMHAYQLDGGPEWHATALDTSGVYVMMGKAQLCRYISRIVAGRTMWSLDAINYGTSPRRPHTVYPDEMGGAIIGDEYLGYAEWLRRVIPKTTLTLVDIDPS